MTSVVDALLDTQTIPPSSLTTVLVSISKLRSFFVIVYERSNTLSFSLVLGERPHTLVHSSTRVELESKLITLELVDLRAIWEVLQMSTMLITLCPSLIQAILLSWDGRARE